MPEFYPIILLIIGCQINGSFVIPVKYITKKSLEQIWLCHAIIGMAIFPWLFFLL